MKPGRIPSYILRLALSTALIAVAATALMAAHGSPTPTGAAGPVATATAAPNVPNVSLDVVQRYKKPNDACPTIKEKKCTLNVGDSFDVLIKINNFPTGLSNSNYGNWDATLTYNGVTNKTITIPDGACHGLGAVKDLSLTTIGCSNSNGTSNSPLLASASFNCAASGTLTLTLVSIQDDGNKIALGGNKVPVDVVSINCGESATLSLQAKGAVLPERMLVNDKLRVGILLSNLKLKDADGDGTAGYHAWQARVNFDADGLELQDAPAFKLPLNATTATSAGTGTVLLGATVAPGAGETNAVGNLVNLTFKCTDPGLYKITLKPTSALETFVVSEKNSDDVLLTLSEDSITVDCRSAVMSIGVKAGAKTSQGNTYWVYQGDKVTVSVRVDEIRKLTYDAAVALILFSNSDISYKSTQFMFPPCVATGTAHASSGEIEVECSTSNNLGNSDFQGGNVFDLVFTCREDTPNGVTSTKLELADAGLVDKDTIWQPVFFSNNSVTIHCVGDGSDKDKDGCSVIQEQAITEALELSPPLDPNVPDYWDANPDQRIDIRDVLIYVKRFGQKPSGTVLNTDSNDSPGPRIDIDDIINVIKLYGTNCK